MKVDIVTSDDIKIYYTGKFQYFTARYIIKYLNEICPSLQNCFLHQPSISHKHASLQHGIQTQTTKILFLSGSLTLSPTTMTIYVMITGSFNLSSSNALKLDHSTIFLFDKQLTLY